MVRVETEGVSEIAHSHFQRTTLPSKPFIVNSRESPVHITNTHQL